jgi:hypothetical protein
MATIATQTSGYVLSQETLDRCYQRAPIFMTGKTASSTKTLRNCEKRVI